MKKIFESWRKYQLNEQVETDALGYQAAGHTVSSMKVSSKDAKKLLDLARTISSFVDPTGVLSWPEWVDAKEDFLKNPSFFNSSMFLLATIGVIPVFGGVVSAPGKIGKLGKLATKGAEEAAGVGMSLSGKTVQVAGHADKINRAKTIVKESLAARALKEAFESGVINQKRFTEWYTKNVNAKATRQEIVEAWETINKYVGGIETTDPHVLYRALNGQLNKLVEKFGVGITQGPGETAGGWVMSLGATAPEVWNKYIRNINKIDEIPSVSVGIGVGTQTAAKGGKNLVRALIHEIGHIQVLQKLPILAKPFMREYLSLITKRMDDIARRYKLKTVDLEDAEELYSSWRDRLPEWQMRNPDARGYPSDYLAMWRMKIGKMYPDETFGPGEKEKLIAALQYIVLRETKKQMSRGGRAGLVPKSQKIEFMMEPMRSNIYGLFQDVKSIAAGLGVKQKGSFYFLNFEEVGAELFEKAVRKRIGDPNTPLVSENFPETIKIFQDIIDKEIATMLEESLKPNSSKLIISIKRTII
jgi:hypothetical protein